MYLKRLDIQGFKSFPDKVRLEFNKGITAVVGPNGSGKSNISDSVRWVLGEQKAKSLRGDKMEDVIFSGTQNRKPLGFAEVSITIDNEDQKMPIAYTEVTVTRRVFRSGDSEYLINGTGCRLKDVHELFMDTGIGREGYSIIGQGRIDEILSVKGDDRRRLFEEAAGIVKYKNRKLEAEGKLLKEQQNLIRVEDIIEELAAQIGPMQEQAETAKKYLKWRDELKQAEVQSFCIQADALQDAERQTARNEEILAGQLQEEEKAQAQEKEESVNLRQKMDAYAGELQKVNDAIAISGSEMEQMEGEAKLAKEQIQHLDSTAKRLAAEIVEKKKKEGVCEQNILACESKQSGLSMNILSLSEQLGEQETVFSTLSSQLNKDEEQVASYKADMIEKMKATTALKERLSRSQAMQEQFVHRKKQLQVEKESLRSQQDANAIHRDAAKKTAENCEKEEKQILENIETQKKEKDRETAAIAELERQYAALNREQTEKNSKYRVLAELEKAHEGFFKSVKAILKQKQEGNQRFQGIHGVLGELLTVPQELETAIEIALGGSIQNLVTEKEEDAKAAIAYLKNNNLGRATFLPISAVRGKGLGSERAQILREAGVIGIAKELIQFEPIYAEIVASLLGRVIICKDLDSAIAFSKKYQYKYRTVTLEGDVLNPGGAMTGGSLAKKVTNVFGRSREVKELREKIASLTTSLEEVKIRLEEKKETLDSITETITELAEEQTKMHIQMLSALQDASQTESVLQEQEEKLKYLAIEEGQIAEQIAQADGEMDKCQGELAYVDAEIAAIDQKLLLFQDNMEQERSGRDEILNAMTELKIAISNYEQNKEAAIQEEKRLQAEIALLRQDMEKSEREISAIQREMQEKEQRAIQLTSQLEEKKQEAQEKKDALIRLTEERRGFGEKAARLEESIACRMDTITKVKNELFKLETKQEKIQEERQRLFDSMWEEYEITYQMAKEGPAAQMPLQDLLQLVKRIKMQIRDLGSVNVEAIEQYKEMRGRLDFLSSQKEDIIEAEKKLGGIITDLTTQMELQFREQFAVISKNFNEVFAEMFGGGKAYLKLSDEEKVLESGIEIIAQPPGKNLQSMMLLSGGERALTAIAILFAILKIKPSPFCILDEIEAALDDANVARYANYLKRFSGDTQFIVITHRKGTMESADVMYGVTMQEQGVSKLVSVKFQEEAV